MKHLFVAFAITSSCLAYSEGIEFGNESGRATFRELQIDNGQVRAWRTIIYPNNPLKMHRHDHPRVVVAIKGGVLKKIDEQGNSSDQVFETGRAVWLNSDPVGELHLCSNEGDEAIEVVVIEVVQSEIFQK